MVWETPVNIPGGGGVPLIHSLSTTHGANNNSAIFHDLELCSIINPQQYCMYHFFHFQLFEKK